jgi:sensor histidine kinase YesM
VGSKHIYRYIAIAAFISLGMSILVHFNSILGQILPDTGNFYERRGEETFGDIAGEVFVTFLVALFLFILNYYLLKPFNGSKRFRLTTIILSIVLTIVAVTVLSDLFFTIKHLVSASEVPKRFNLLYTVRDMFVAFVVLICVFFIRLANEKQTIRLENEKLMRENLQSQYESLKNQVSPHFLFNSLTALRELIGDDPENARQYVSHLSSVLRYTLQSNENKTISLSDELESAKSYLFLIKIRFGENLMTEFKINENYKSHRLPPLSVQTLIENAVKHNEISKRNPFTMKIYTTDNSSLIVSNTLKEKLSLEPGTGIGLANLSKQYKLLCGEEIRISKKNDEFMVEIPLLKPLSDEGSNS